MAAKGYAKKSDRVYCAKMKMKTSLRIVMYRSGGSEIYHIRTNKLLKADR